jgi:hypothetical protein
MKTFAHYKTLFGGSESLELAVAIAYFSAAVVA